MPSIKSIQIVGFTPFSVILAERLSYSSTDIICLEQTSTLSIDTHWQSVSLLCLIHLLKQCRMLLSNTSKKFGINIQNVNMNEELVYAYIKSVTKSIQKYYLTLLKQRKVKFVSSTDRTENDNDLQLTSKILVDENCTRYVAYSRSSYPEFDQSPRLNVFHAIFEYLLRFPSLKLIGPDIFAFELAHLLASLGHNQIYLYRMNPNETSILSTTQINSTLITLFQIFSKFIHEPLIRTVSDESRPPILQIIEQFHQFRINVDAEGRLEYVKYVQPIMPISRTLNETKRDKRAYLETFRQSAYESTIKLTTANIRDDNNTMTEEPLNQFSPSSTFFVVTDVIAFSDTPLLEPPFSKAIRTFNTTPGSLIFNIYEALRTISGDETIPRLTNLFLSADQELCVMQNPITVRNGEFGADNIKESEQHNPHDFYKVIQRPTDPLGTKQFYESQLFRSDAFDLQSFLLLYNPREEIPPNELIFLFDNEYDWHNQLVLPDRMTVKNNIQRNSI